MNLKLEDGTIISNCKRVTDRSDIDISKRFFYELGTYFDINLKDWRLSGVFKEIKDVEKFVRLDDRLDDPKYIYHHNFCVQD